MNAPLPTAFSIPGHPKVARWRRYVTAFKKQWERFLNIGVHEGLNSWELKRVRLLNGIAALSLVMFSVYWLVMLFSPDYITAWLCFPIVILHLGIPILNHYRHYNAAAYYFILIGTVIYSFVPIAKKHDGSEYALIVYALMGMMFFRSFWKIMVLFLINMGAFFAVRYAITVVPPFLYIPKMTDVYQTNLVLFFAGLFLVVYHFRTENARQEMLLHEQKDQLQQSLTQLHTTQAQLIQREKLASLGELMAGIAHEIQNPLNFVTNFSELSVEAIQELREELQKGPEGDAALESDLVNDLDENLGKIKHHGLRASNIVRGMLEHSRGGTGERRPSQLNLLIEEYLTLSYMGYQAKSKSFVCQVVTHIDPAIQQIDIVPQDIGRVLLNLFNNAFYAVDKKQADAGYQPTVTVSTRLQKGMIEISVQDNGMGISAAVRDKIFQPFFTTKPAGSGTGLGLSLSYDIITKGHNGTLTVESTEGEGTTFIVKLPG